MTGRVFLDTNVVICAVDKVGLKRDRARELLANDPVVSLQVVNENFPVSALRMLRERGLDVMAIIETMPAEAGERRGVFRHRRRTNGTSATAARNVARDDG